MKTALFILIVLFNLPLFAQTKNEFNIGYRYGLSTKHLKLSTSDRFNRLDHKTLTPFSDKSYFIGYNKNVWNRQNLYLNIGIDVATATHYLPIFHQQTSYNLENVILKNKRIDLSLGVSKQIDLYKSKNIALELGYNVVYRQYLKNLITTEKLDYSNNNEDWIEYKYKIETYDIEAITTFTNIRKISKFSNFLFANLKLKVFNTFYYNLGINYLSNISFYTNYTYDMFYYHNNSPTPTGHNSYTVSKPKEIKTNYLYLNTSLSYKF